MKLAEKYRQVVFVQGDEAEEVLGTILYEHVPGSVVWSGPYEETIAAAAGYLARWDDGGCEVSDTPSAGPDDDTARAGEYLLSWSLGAGWVGLERVLIEEGYLTAFTAAYLAAGLESAGRSVLTARVTPEAMELVLDDCEAFLHAVSAIAAKLGGTSAGPRQFGRDFWLARNGVPGGLRDQDAYPRPAARLLTELACGFGGARFTPGGGGRAGYEREKDR
jgi:hypothetical protein